MDSLPKSNQFCVPLKSSYKDAYGRQQINRRTNFKGKDQNLFFELPFAKTAYQNHFKDPLTAEHPATKSLKQAPTLGNHAAQGFKYTTTAQEYMQKQIPQQYKEDSDYIVKRQILSRL